jgi:hypothetical protein
LVHFRRWNEETEGWTWYTWLAFYVPLLGWIRTYQWRSWLIVSLALCTIHSAFQVQGAM